MTISVLTWKSRLEAVRGSAGGDASDDAVEEEADPLSFGRGQEEDSSPWKGGRGDRGRMGKHKNSREAWLGSQTAAGRTRSFLFRTYSNRFGLIVTRFSENT